MNENILAVRRGELSPIGIKRPRPFLEKVERPETPDERDLSEGKERILGLITGSISTEKKREIERTFLDTRPICINSNTAPEAEEAERYYEHQGITVGRWKPRNYRWEQVKEIPLAETDAESFCARGTSAKMPKDVMRWSRRGGNPNKNICPSCPVYDACQARGYLSQFETLKEKRVIVSDIPNLFLDRRYAAFVDALSVPNRICIINDSESQLAKLFSEYHLSIEILEGWAH